MVPIFLSNRDSVVWVLCLPDTRLMHQSDNACSSFCKRRRCALSRICLSVIGPFVDGFNEGFGELGGGCLHDFNQIASQ